MWTGRQCLWPLNCHWRWVKDTSLWHTKRCQSMEHRHNSPTLKNLKFSPWWEKWRWPSFGTAKVVKTLITIAAYWSRQPHNYSCITILPYKQVEKPWLHWTASNLMTFYGTLHTVSTWHHVTSPFFTNWRNTSKDIGMHLIKKRKQCAYPVAGKALRFLPQQDATTSPILAFACGPDGDYVEN